MILEVPADARQVRHGGNAEPVELRTVAYSRKHQGVASENPVQIDSRSAAESEHHRRMIALGLLFLRLLCDRFRFAPDSGHRPVLFDHSILPEGRYFA
jgi:hypothetical protein